MSRGVTMTHRQKCLLHSFYLAAQRHRPKSYRAGHWYRQGNSQQQLFYHGDITPSVSSAAIFDAPTPCCGVNYRCRATPSVNVALWTRPRPQLLTCDFKCVNFESNLGIDFRVFKYTLLWYQCQRISLVVIQYYFRCGVVPEGTKPLPVPVLTKISDAIWYH